MKKSFLECVSLAHRKVGVSLPGEYESQGLVLGVEGDTTAGSHMA